MDSAAAPDNNHPEPEVGQQQETRQFSRARGRNKSDFDDLRQLLVRRRRTQHDASGNGPPPEPGYNFLADPLRDNDQDARNTGGDRRPENYGSGRFSPRQHGTVMFENRNRGGGRGRGRANSFWKDEQSRQPGGDHRRETEWKEERNRVDRERMQRQRSDSGGWKREWDAGKEDMWKGPPHNSAHKHQQHSPQHRPATGPHPNRRYRPPPPRQEGGELPQEQATVDTSNETTLEPKDGANQAHQRPIRQFYGDNGRGGKQYRPPTYTKYNAGYHSRGGRSRRPNPMNITVEFSADTGERTCTIGKSRPVPKARPKRGNRVKREPKNDASVPETEENWDDDNKAVEKNVVENVSEISKCEQAHDECEEKFPEETVKEEQPANEERYECEVEENEGAEYDDVNEEQYKDAEEKPTDAEEKNTDTKNTDTNAEGENSDADTLQGEQNDNERTKPQTDNKESKDERDSKECCNSQAKKDEIADEVKQKEKDLQMDSTNVVAKCDGEKDMTVTAKGEEDVKTPEVKPQEKKEKDK